MNELTITPGFYKHWKGQIYYVIEVVVRRGEAPFVVYSACYEGNYLHTRPVSEWFNVMGQKENGEPLYRFEKINHEVAEVRHGEWIGHGSRTTLKCSECGKWQPAYAHDPWSYCPNCGAKMDGKENE